MSHWIKNIFSSRKKESSDDDLIEIWNNSEKNLQDFQESILKITNQETRSKCILEQGLNVVIPEDAEDIKNFLTVMASLYQTEKQLNKSKHAQKNDKNNKRLVELIKRIEFYQGLCNIITEICHHENKSKTEIKAKLSKIINLNLLLRANKYENLSIILSQIAIIQNENKELSLQLKDYLFDYFFNTESEYYKCLEYFLLKIEEVFSPDSDNSVVKLHLKYLLPNQQNLKFFNSKNFIKLRRNISSVFSAVEDDLNEDEEYSLFDLNLNILIILNSEKFQIHNEKREKYSKFILDLIKEQNSSFDYKLLSLLYSTYSIYTELFRLSSFDFISENSNTKEKEKTFSQFIQHDLFSSFDEKLFTRLNKISIETFEDKIQKIFSFHKENSELIQSLGKNKKTLRLSKIFENFLKIIYIQLMRINTPIKFLTIYLRQLFNYYSASADSNDCLKTLTNLTLKVLIENLSDTYQNNILLLEILTENKNLLQCDNLITELKLKTNFLEITEKTKKKLNLCDLIKNEFLIASRKIKFEESEIFSIFLEFFAKIAKNLKNLENLKFLEKNKET